MTNIHFRKEKISIKNIGRQRFWIGVVAGLISAISISLFFNHSREVLRLFTGMSTDLLILKENELLFFNYFFSLLSSVLGLSITIWLWLQNKKHNRKKDRIYKQLSVTNTILIFWFILMIISRFGSILPIVLFGTPGYDNHLNLYEEYWILFVLIPIVVFTQSWFAVRLVYQAGRWIFLSFLFCILTAFTLQLTTTVNQEKLNSAYHQRYERDYNYIDQEIRIAKEKYGIDYNEQTVEILKKRFTESSVKQIESIKNVFSANKPVTLDTIILQKIIIRNYKEGGWYYYRRNSIENWRYALPIDILKQLSFFEQNSKETKELFEVLKEMIDLVNTPEIHWEAYQNFTETERRRSLGARYNIPAPLIEQLKEVRTRLLKEERYSNSSKDLKSVKDRE
ncbi:hypothetical protein DN752_05175 [Echinicola strongylocentroti]|uniref:Uncharacterized protein n=1 Tax=Echinicola strongylocentroti TaxID=1795355 RepID=A0A2Z4IFV4_9BACT|nr:hypothetical protein [Echinicola strongylocentroti]AWW29567.1 hypothetical protein DN752_05175 [Echinicola strongylocentroti]